MIEYLPYILCMFFFGSIILGGCSCCAYCDICLESVTSVQVTVSGITADEDTLTCCTAMNKVYVLAPATDDCCWEMGDIPGTDCLSASCLSCTCSYVNAGCTCTSEYGVDPTHCDPLGSFVCRSEGGALHVGTLSNTAACDACNDDAGHQSVCSGLETDPPDVGCPNLDCGTSGCDHCTCSPTGDYWTAPEDLPPWANYGDEKYSCVNDGGTCGTAHGTCGKEYADIRVCLGDDGSGHGQVTISGHLGGTFSGSKADASAPLDCTAVFDLDATGFADWTWTQAGNMCNQPTGVDIDIE